jgi:hypothetical protein
MASNLNMIHKQIINYHKIFPKIINVLNYSHVRDYTKRLHFSKKSRKRIKVSNHFKTINQRNINIINLITPSEQLHI